MAGKLTTDRIEKEAAPETGAKTLWDAGDDDCVKGFGVRIFAPTKRHPNGARSFFLNYRIEGTERRYTIGDFPTWTLKAARAEAKELRKLVDQGRDPVVEKRERAGAPTIQNLVDRYIAEHLPTKTIGTYRQNDERRMLEIIEVELGKDRKVADVHHGDIAEMHKRITASDSIGKKRGQRSVGKGRPVRANRILGVASKMFALSLLPKAGETKPWRDAVQGNPCKGVKRNHEDGRERFFGQAELAAISDALADYGTTATGPGVKLAKAAADCIRLIMLTGCRPIEAQLAAWQQFDAEPGYWVKPSAHVKSRKVHKLPLSPAALQLIERLRQDRGDDPWVFPGGKAGEPIKALWHGWHWVRDRAGLKDARIYDLRHTFASIGAGGGLSLPIIGRLLGHTQSRTTQRYAHLADDPVREAADKIATVISNAGRPGADVTPLRRGG